MADNSHHHVTPAFRMSFQNLLEPKGFKGSEPKYSVVCLFPEGEKLNDIQASIKAVIKEKWGDNPPKKLKLPIHDQEEKEEYDGYEAGSLYCTLSSKYAPQIIMPDKSPLVADDEVYSGRWARATCNVYAWDNDFGKGVSIGLKNVQLLRHADNLTGRKSAVEEFDEVEIDDDDDDLDPFD